MIRFKNSGPRFVGGLRGGGGGVHLDTKEDLPCPSCGAAMRLPLRDLFPGNRVTCSSCGDEHEIPEGAPDGRKIVALTAEHEANMRDIFKRK